MKEKCYSLNLSKIAENAIFSIIDFLDAQNQKISSVVLGEASFQEGSMVPRANFTRAFKPSFSS